MNRKINRSIAHQDGRICSKTERSTNNSGMDYSGKNLIFNLMKAFFFLMLLVSGSLSAQSIFTNPITGSNPSSSNPYTSGQTVNSNITVSGIGFGAGMSASPGNDRFIIRGVNGSSLTSNDYFEFTLTPKSCYEIDFVSLVYTSQLSTSGSVSLALRSSIDNYTNSIVTSSNASGATMSLAGENFQNRTSATTFRLYVWGAGGSSTTFSINSFTFNGTVNALSNTISLSSAAGSNVQTRNLNTAISSITYNTTMATGATFSGLPSGVNGTWASNVVTISGTPSASGTFNYTVTLTGGCGSVQASGSITVNPLPVITSVIASSPNIAGQPAASGYRGQTITISGANFAANAQVRFNGVSASSVIVVSSATITAIVNNTGLNSTGNLIVSNPSTAASASTAFNFIGYVTNSDNFDWSSNASWLGNEVPANGADVSILHNGTIGYNLSVTCNRIEIKSGKTFNIGTEGAITVSDLQNDGVLNWTSAGTLNIGGQLIMSAAAAIQPGNGTIAYSKAGNQNLVAGSAAELIFNNLVLSGSGVKLVPAGKNLQVKNLSIGNGVTFTPNAAGGLAISGDLAVEGTLTSSASVFTFNSNSDQSISVAGIGTAVFSALRLNKAAGTLLLNDNVRILDTLTMIAGNINTQGNILEIGSSLASKGVLAYTSGYIHGKLRRWYNGTNSGNGSGLFPMGELKSGNWENRKALLEYTAAPSIGGHLTVEFIPVSMNANGTQASIDLSGAGGTGFNITNFAEEGYWKIDNQAGTLTDGAYNIALTAENFTSIGADLSMLSMVKRVSMGNWFAPGQHIPASGDISVVTISRSGVTGFSNFGFGIGEPYVPLPVTISFMAVNCDGLYPSLNWTTLSEQDASQFLIQQSADGRSWKNLGSLAAAGNSNNALRYSYSLEAMSNASAYVRLVLQNRDGSEQAFAPLALSCRQSLKNTAFALYPNPTEGAFIIDLQNTSEGNMSIRVLNTMGVEVAQQLHNAARSSQVKMDLNDFATGIYQVLVGTEGEAPAQLFKLIIR